MYILIKSNDHNEIDNIKKLLNNIYEDETYLIPTTNIEAREIIDEKQISLAFIEISDLSDIELAKKINCKFYDIDDEIKNSEAKNEKRYPIRLPKYPTLSQKVLYLVAYETYYDRYLRQVTLPFIDEEQENAISNRLSEVFTGKERVQKDCTLEFFAKNTTSLRLCSINLFLASLSPFNIFSISLTFCL